MHNTWGGNAAVTLISFVLVPLALQGCGHGGDSPSPTPAPSTPEPPVPPKTPPSTSNWTYRIPPSSSFYCITEDHKPKTSSQSGFFMYRWASQRESSLDVDSDNFGDINPYYLLTELLTNVGTNPLASKPTCQIPKCGEANDDCVLKRVYLMMDNSAAQSVLMPGGTWGQYLACDNGIASDYSYWAFNESKVPNPNKCKKGSPSHSCNFYFEGGYPVGCQPKSDLMDTPVWYSTIAGCPMMPFAPASPNPSRFDAARQNHAKTNKGDPAVKQCFKEMPGGNCQGGGKNSTPFNNKSATCTWKAYNAGYLTIEDVLNIPAEFSSYKAWCLKQPDDITKWGDGTGIPSNLTLFYDLAVESFPALHGINSSQWHTAASTDEGTISDAAKAVFKAWAKGAKERLEDMFTEMDKQAFAQFKSQGKKDPDGNAYENCLSNKDVTVPACNVGAVQAEAVWQTSV